jgi:hypothetical protein
MCMVLAVSITRIRSERHLLKADPCFSSSLRRQETLFNSEAGQLRALSQCHSGPQNLKASIAIGEIASQDLDSRQVCEQTADPSDSVSKLKHWVVGF